MYLNVCFITTTTDIFYMWHCIFTQFEAGTEPPYSLACVACGNFIFTSVMWNISKWNLWEFISQKWSTHTYMKERTRKGESLFIYSRTHSCWTSLEYSLLLKLYACDFWPIFELNLILVRFYGCWWDLDGEKWALYIRMKLDRLKVC